MFSVFGRILTRGQIGSCLPTTTKEATEETTLQQVTSKKSPQLYNRGFFTLPHNGHKLSEFGLRPDTNRRFLYSLYSAIGGPNHRGFGGEGCWVSMPFGLQFTKDAKTEGS